MKEFDAKILDYLEGTLPDDERSFFEGQLFDSARNLALIDDYEQLLVLEYEASQVDSLSDPQLTEEIMAKVSKEKLLEPPPFFDRFFFQGFSSAVLTSLLLFCLLGPSRVLDTVRQLAFYDTPPRVPDYFQTVSLGTKDGLPPGSAVNARQDVEVLLELSAEDGEEEKIVSGVLRIGRFPGSRPLLILDEQDVKTFERVKRLIGT